MKRKGKQTNAEADRDGAQDVDKKKDKRKDKEDAIKYRSDGTIDIDAMLKEANAKEEEEKGEISVTYIISNTIIFVSVAPHSALLTPLH